MFLLLDSLLSVLDVHSLLQGGALHAFCLTIDASSLQVIELAAGGVVIYAVDTCDDSIQDEWFINGAYDGIAGIFQRSVTVYH